MIQIFIVRWLIYGLLHGLWWIGEIPWWVAPLVIVYRELDLWRCVYVLPSIRRNWELQRELYQVKMLAGLQAHKGAEPEHVIEPRVIDPEKEGWH